MNWKCFERRISGFLLCILFFLGLCACSDNTTVLNYTQISTRSTADTLHTPYIFACKVGDDQWKSLSSGQKMLEACQIPNDVLSSLSTKALCETCMDYPLAYDYIYANDEKESTNFHIEHFNGLKELANREDKFLPLIEAYKGAQYEPLPDLQYGVRNNNLFYLGYIELLLSSDSFYSHFSSDQIGMLKDAALEKYDYELGNIEVFGLYSIRRTVMLIAKCVLSEGKLVGADKEWIEDYIENYQTLNAESLEETTKIITTH